MKNFLTLMLLTISLPGFSQTVTNINGSAGTFSRYLGAYGPDKFLRAPKRDLNIIFHVTDSVGNMQVDPVDSCLAYYNGRAWQKPITGVKAIAICTPLFLPISYVPDWSTVGNKPTFAPVAFSGLYSDLTGFPAIPTNTNQLTNGAGFLTSASLSPYATLTAMAATYFPKPTGLVSEYLTGNGTLATFPVIPAAQIQSDWTQTNSGLPDFIKNKPTISNFSAGFPVTITAGSNVMGGIVSGSYVNGTAYRLSTTQDLSVSVSASCQVAITLLSTGAGTVYIETSPNGSTGWVFRGNVTKNSANTIGLTTVNGGSLTFVLPKGHYYRIQTATSVTGLLPITAISYTMDGGSYVPLN